MITLLDEQGRRMFAFHPLTDPQPVLIAICFAWTERKYIPPGQSLCGLDCPFIEGGYCVDCHVVAYNALAEVRRFVAWKNWLITGELPNHD